MTYKFILKSFAFALALAFSLFFIQPSSGANRPPDSKDVQELQKFGHLELGKGNLLTPARGAISSRTQAVRALVQKIVLNLAAEDLAAKKINYVINIYGNNTINAWVQQIDPTKSDSAEGVWLKENPDRVWPLRQAWGFQENQNPIYEIGVTTGLLRALSTQDELAFIMGHELTHLFEGHTNHAADPKERMQKWWSSQSHEVVADHLAIDRMLGKYELDAALNVMDKLFPQKTNQETDPSEAIYKIAATHHDEGVRISTLQFYIEYLRRFNPKANIKAEVKLPRTVKLNAHGRSAAEVPSEVKPESRIKYLEIVQSIISGHFDNSQLLITKNNRHKAFSPYGFLGDKTHSYQTLLLDALNAIEATPISKEEKINSLLKVMIFLGSRASAYYPAAWFNEWFGSLTQQELRRLMIFLITNASGKSAWGRKSFTKLLQSLTPETLIYIQVPFLGNEKGQWLYKRLSKISKAWGEFFEYQTSMLAYERENKFYTGDFADFLSFLGREKSSEPKDSLREKIGQKILSELSNYPNSEKLVQSLDENGLPYFMRISAPGGKESNWDKARNQAAEPHAHLLNKILFEGITKGLEKTTSQSKEKPEFADFHYTFAIESMDLTKLNNEQLNQLLKAFEGFISYASVPRKGALFTPAIDSLKILDLCAKLGQRRQGDREYQLKLFNFVTMQLWQGMAINESSEATQVFFREALSSLSIDEKFSILEHLTPEEREIRQRIDYLAKKYKVTSFFSLQDKINQEAEHLNNDDARADLANWSSIPTLSQKRIQNMLLLLQEFSVNRQMDLTYFKRLLRNFELAEYYGRFSFARTTVAMPTNAAALFFQMMYDNIFLTSSLEEAAQLYSRTIKILGKGFVAKPEDQKMLRAFFAERMSKVPLKTQVRWIKQAEVRQVLGARFTGETLATYVITTQKGIDRAHVRREVDRLEQLIPLKDQWPEAYTILREILAEKINLQPHEVDSVFAKSELSVTQRADEGNTLVRGLSGFSAYTRAMPYNEQIEMIEFMMGRSNKMPKTLEKQEIVKNKIDVRALMLTMREELKYRSVLDRAMVINSIFTGANAIIQSDEGLKLVHDHLLKSVSPQNREIAEVLLKALAAAEGRNKSLLLSYSLAQKIDSESDNKEKTKEGLTEALVLRSLLDAYGVPGVKLAQYLAFTSEFKDFQSALEVYQDAAMPISYYDALLLLQKRLGGAWDPSLYRVTSILGSGSVNIAIEYENLKTGKKEALSIAREQIEVKTTEDFRRFQLLIRELTRTPERREKFAFISGLLDLIKKSVELEFDKENSFKIQQSVQSLYRQEIDGWNIQSVDAFEVMGMGIRMEKAPGLGARKILKSDPKTYESAMRAFMKAEYGVLRGVDETRNWTPLPLFANPDVHDGQILIDVPNRTITILDFGQALEISNDEREFALDILRIISGVESVRSAQQIIQKHALSLEEKVLKVDKQELALTLKRGDRMDVFVHFLSLLDRSGFEVPLPTVHWVLGANRLIKLGEKINVSAESSFRWLLGMKKVGLPLTVYNAAASLKDKTQAFIQGFKLKAPAAQSCEKVFLH